MQLLILIDLNMNPSPPDDFIVAQDRSFLKPRWSGKRTRDSLWNFNRFSLGKPCQKRLLSKMQLLILIDLNMNPSPQDDFIVAQDRSFLKPRWSGKSGTSQVVSLEHAKASAALAASFKSASRTSISSV